MSMRDKMRDLGYSKEDAYFLKKDQDLIDKMRKEAARRKREVAEKHKGAPYWMKCPKCGSDLEEECYSDLGNIDRCTGCSGLYLDKGELAIILKAQSNRSLGEG